VPVDTLVGFLLALVRTTSWMAVSPPFDTKAIPRLAKLGIACGISIFLAPQVPPEVVSLNQAELAIMIVTQMVTGLALGFLTKLVFTAVQVAGSLIDFLGGFALTQAFDPLLSAQTSIFGRVYALLATTLLFAINGHLMLVKGFMTSFEAVPLGGIEFETFKDLLINNLGMFMFAAFEIAGPLLAAYFLTEVTLGLLSKAAPQLNIILFGFPLKVLLTILLISAALPLLPGAVESLVEHTLRDGLTLLRGGDG